MTTPSQTADRDPGEQHAAGRDQGSELAHAVPRSAADGPPPWVAVCGTPVAAVQGSWAGRRGLGSPAPCPVCAARVPA